MNAQHSPQTLRFLVPSLLVAQKLKFLYCLSPATAPTFPVHRKSKDGKGRERVLLPRVGADWLGWAAANSRNMMEQQFLAPQLQDAQISRQTWLAHANETFPSWLIHWPALTPRVPWTRAMLLPPPTTDGYRAATGWTCLGKDSWAGVILAGPCRQLGRGNGRGRGAPGVAMRRHLSSTVQQVRSVAVRPWAVSRHEARLSHSSQWKCSTWPVL